ncbi:MAG: GntR family transcriptional regulator [Anaerolineae bacterium]|nr:GntR family transcriptional regulator [Anaerolineae bacterium]
MTSKKIDVYYAVRKSIISGVIRQGEIINEGELAREYGVSRTPVREALLTLVADGLLNSLPRAGYMVTPITIRDVQEAFHLREILETDATRLATLQISEVEIDDLESRKMGVPPYLNPAYNREFHHIIASASGNQRLARLIDQLLDEMGRILAYDPYIDNPHDPAEHQRIIDALRDRDSQAAQDAMCAHLRLVKSRVLERF